MVISMRLSQGKVSIVDEEFAYLGLLKWSAQKKQKCNGGNVRFYAIRIVDKKSILLHRVIMEHVLGRALNPGEEIDHIDHDGLNNLKANLRLVTKSQNMQNCRKPKRASSSIYKGVYWDGSRRRWRSSIKVGNDQLALGDFKIERDAAIAYDKAALRYFGEFANTNRLIE